MHDWLVLDDDDDDRYELYKVQEFSDSGSSCDCGLQTFDSRWERQNAASQEVQAQSFGHRICQLCKQYISIFQLIKQCVCNQSNIYHLFLWLI